MLAIIDYEVGNLFSLRSSFGFLGQQVVITGDPALLRRADKLILPGVGAFADAAKKLRVSGLDSLIQEEARRGKPLLGICLGMQLLFDESYEYGRNSGLGLIKGSVEPIGSRIPAGLKIPHIGWNALLTQGNSPLFRYVDPGECVYFVHSYHGVTAEENIIAKAEYGALLTAAVADGSVFGCQFHPEKSGDTGLRILKAFCEL